MTKATEGRNWSRQASHSGLWASPPPRTTSTNANKPVRKASSDPVLRRSVALVVQSLIAWWSEAVCILAFDLKEVG